MLFLKCKEHLLKQNCRAIYLNKNGSKECACRGENQTACAIGCLIKDQHYSTGLEGKLAEHPEVLEAIAKSQEIPPEEINAEMLIQLQSVHDDLDVGLWPEELQRLEGEYFP